MTAAQLEKPVQDYLGKDAWTLWQLRCIPCEYGKFTSVHGKSACAECQPYQHVLHQDVSVQIRTTADHGKTEPKKVPLLKSCLVCPVGTEYHASAAAVTKDARCSSSNITMQSFTVLILNVPYTLTIPTAGSCCRPCFLNTYRKQTETRICSSGRSTQPTFAPYGQVSPMKCIEGQQKKFCMFKHEWTKFDKRLFPCTSQGAGSDEDWATCVTCLQTERPIKVGEDHECQLCNKEESGEYFRDGKCQTCGSCSILTPVFTFEKFE